MSDPSPNSNLVNREAWHADLSARKVGRAGNILEPLSLDKIEDQSVAYGALKDILFFRDDEDVQAQALDEHIRRLETVAKTKRGNPFLNSADVAALPSIASIILGDPRVKEFIAKRDLAKADEELRRIWPEFAAKFKAGIRQGIDSGFLPAASTARADSALDKTTTRIIDGSIFDHIYRARAAADYNNTEDQIGLRHDFELLDEDYDESLAHEFAHQISGGTFTKDKSNAGAFNRPRIGFATEKTPGAYLRVATNEAVTQHVALGIMTGDFQTFDPDERTDSNKTYYAPRKVFATYIDRSAGFIDVKTVTNAFMEDTGPHGSTASRTKLIEESVRAYGYGALLNLEILSDFATIVDEPRLNELVLNRIQPPEVDEHGHVIRQGSIDVTNLPTFYDLYVTKVA